MHERFEGFRHALRTAGLDWATALLERVGTASHANGVELGRELLTRHPNAIAGFATADILAIGIVAGLGAAGFDGPGDVSVAGFDDLDPLRHPAAHDHQPGHLPEGRDGGAVLRASIEGAGPAARARHARGAARRAGFDGAGARHRVTIPTRHDRRG